jgi:cyanate permease
MSGSLLAVVASFLAGLALIRGAPARWHVDPWQGVLLGTALYMGVIHRWLAWHRAAKAAASAVTPWARESAWAATWSLGWRIGVFLGLIGVQAFVYFDWLPAADLRAPFVMLSGWITAETLLSPRRREPDLSAASPRA